MPVVHLNFFFGEVSVHILDPFLNRVICFLGVEVCEFFIFLDVDSLLYMSFTNMFSHTVGCLFVLLMVFFAVQKLFSMM